MEASVYDVLGSGYVHPPKSDNPEKYPPQKISERIKDREKKGKKWTKYLLLHIARKFLLKNIKIQFFFKVHLV